VVEEGAIADGDSIANVNLLEDPAKILVVVMEDGTILENTRKCCPRRLIGPGQRRLSPPLSLNSNPTGS
jgi:hypothetical protein